MSEKKTRPRFPWLVPQFIFEKLKRPSGKDDKGAQKVDRDYIFALGILLLGVVLFLFI